MPDNCWKFAPQLMKAEQIDEINNRALSQTNNFWYINLWMLGNPWSLKTDAKYERILKKQSSQSILMQQMTENFKKEKL